MKTLTNTSRISSIRTGIMKTFRIVKDSVTEELEKQQAFLIKIKSRNLLTSVRR